MPSRRVARAAGLGEDEPARVHVPRLEDRLPEAVGPARRDVAEVERRGAVAADGARVAHEPVERPQALLELLVQVVRKAGDQQAAG